MIEPSWQWRLNAFGLMRFALASTRLDQRTKVVMRRACKEHLPLCSISFWEIPPSQLIFMTLLRIDVAKIRAGCQCLVNIGSCTDHVLGSQALRI